MARHGLLLVAMALVAACGSSAPAASPGPVYLWVSLDMGSSPIGERTDWSATVCADQDCRSYSVASCQAAPEDACFIGVGITVQFKYGSAADLPQHLSVRIVSDSGKLLYSHAKNDDCHLEQAICESTFIVP